MFVTITNHISQRDISDLIRQSQGAIKRVCYQVYLKDLGTSISLPSFSASLKASFTNKL